MSVAKSGTAAANADLGTFFEPSLANGSLAILRYGISTSANASGGIYFKPNATAANSTNCMAVTGQVDTLCVDGNGTTAVTKPTIATGVGADGSGFKHSRSTTGCTTGAAIGANCSSSVTWTTTFADANYTAVCSCSGVTSGVPVLGSVSTAASQLTVLTVATTASAAKCTNIMCIAAHD
jgi:hypothetical protein